MESHLRDDLGFLEIVLWMLGFCAATYMVQLWLLVVNRCASSYFIHHHALVPVRSVLNIG